MYKLNIQNNDLILVGESGKSFPIRLSDTKIKKSIIAHLKKLDLPCKFSIEIISKTTTHLLLGGKNKILLSKLVAGELIGQLVLANKKLKLPKEEIQEGD